MAFKMKQSPAKGKLGDFFKGVGKKITEGRQKRVDKQLESKKGTEYEGMTSMEAARAEKKSRKSGESKFQADSRKMGEKKRADKKANKAASSIKGEKDNAKPKQANTEIKTKPTPGTDYNYNMTTGFSDPTLAGATKDNYNSMSVNDLVKLRKKGNKDVQKVINAKLKANPNKWD